MSYELHSHRLEYDPKVLELELKKVAETTDEEVKKSERLNRLTQETLNIEFII